MAGKFLTYPNSGSFLKTICVHSIVPILIGEAMGEGTSCPFWPLRFIFTDTNHLSMRYLVCCLSLLFAASVHAQDLTPKAAAAMPLGITDASLFEQLMLTVPGVGSNARLTLEQQSVKSYMMPVRQVGSRGEGWSYALASCLEYYVNLRRNYKDNLSPDFIALSVRAAGQTSTLDNGLRMLAGAGTVSAAIMPYDATEIPAAVYATTKYQIANYLHIFRGFATEREKVFEVRKALMRGNPVLIELAASPEFASQGPALAWEPSGAPNQTYFLLVVGYDETREAFELLGSFGPEWANNGYLWVSYDDFGQSARNGYVLIPNNF